ncbi:unnamed protein product [Gongylonema pulchrum]|uniref:DHO_dh domain-containing protein n=1 Tax=Gongylonema pulchrum TaxID=637853 RepID=A0A183DAJ1_9BILA|nr:unnamed protein product [Gongylonema pulchrum]
MAISNERQPKILIKISPDLPDSDLKAVAQMSLDKRYGIDGVIISNFTAHRSQENTGTAVATTDGFVSGEPLRDISTECIRHFYRHFLIALTAGKVPIIGCGGVSSGQDAYDKIRAGASLIQLYSSLLYQGNAY